MKRTAFFISAVLALAGCSAPSPSVSEYTIFPSPTLHSAPASPLSTASLRIAPTRTLPSLASKNLYYLREGNESGAYLYSRWSDTPASMIERSLVASLEERKVFAVLLSSASSAHSVRLLESDLNAFYHRFLPDGSSEGYIDITYRLVDATTKQTLGVRRFQIASKAPTGDARGGVSALSDATRETSAQCTQWLIQLIQEKQ
ncbi:MAG: membrane integrity-associated transporter subunit PqiC [Campylobacterales bacterium]|nr:membrane integrity-associated transporter subunit PqiC [Campylobacterales bacterium]